MICAMICDRQVKVKTTSQENKLYKRGVFVVDQTWDLSTKSKGKVGILDQRQYPNRSSGDRMENLGRTQRGISEDLSVPGLGGLVPKCRRAPGEPWVDWTAGGQCRLPRPLRTRKRGVPTMVKVIGSPTSFSRRPQ